MRSSQLAGTVLRGLWRLGLPCIRAHAVEVLATPAELHGAMVAGATRAERRLALASLYIGSGERERELVEAMAAGARSTRRQTHLVLDRWRASRALEARRQAGAPASSLEILAPLLDAPREVVGVQHIKGAVFDDDVLLTGANVSADYFSARQDRCILLRGCAPLADLFSELLVALAAAAGTDALAATMSKARRCGCY
ncbi:CDP-diacylglycerol-glycerol-3-phosphate 3-phosphatidyltransferas-like protein [Emiliania huxleyi CCMP1516]|uniref:CDP-diacylglycerol--glycerol-3-phosphate 3-phosphatidyltransferase n=2 Tax=Emiliania huxleyi TaxID=2903 RepID=A0A0D3I5H1_EMIH1|nr:CDP-diacylglycerol-glycerol-3-phosphate 3-phosphatidyltransferas-like protein [Emiliania huxleyi CCMP1516]EOD06506.1 CDP-diacylglycerol-glycerol-3-phosphate 3-phosphatidyltransferas-like protein [Emiliania huxleyi CCMP1516]|eukprot:XP_005758935.1 CDP-diacylglycerol-glycerol-3-phosphate 3-phosphatidyltransferas-like protein [Emiliania huxleyi CCMP1516]